MSKENKLLEELFELNLVCFECDVCDDIECCNGCSTLRRLSELRFELERLED